MTPAVVNRTLTPDQALVRDLAACPDWRERVEQMALSKADSHRLRVAIIGERSFRSVSRRRPRGRR